MDNYDSYAGKLRTNSNIAWHRPQSTGSREEEELMKRSQKASTHTTDPLDKLRFLCLGRGAAGIMGLSRVFRRMADGGNKKELTKEEFKFAIKETGLELNNQETDELFKTLDTENSGTISLDEFLLKIRPPMSESRRNIVEQVFKKLDKNEHGYVTVDDIRKMYSVNSNPRYMSGEDTASTTLTKFLLNFDQQDHTVDGKVTLEEFMNYYSGLSVSIDDDCYFDLMMRQAYKL